MSQLEKNKKLLSENFKYLQDLSVKEYTLYRKWVGLRASYPVDTPVEDDPFGFGGDNPSALPSIVAEVKNNIWVPSKVEDYLDLEPELVSTDEKSDAEIWNTLRHFCHSAIWHPSPGRLLRFYIRDKVSGKYLGTISLGSDFIAIGGRDKYIGWSRDNRLKEGKLRHTAMGSSIMPTQPFGYNYNGGKLIALLTASKPVADLWYKKYGEVLAGVTTTSLYGGSSMYNSLKYWRKCDSTTGEIQMEPSEDVYEVLKDWYAKEYAQSYKDINTPAEGKKIVCHPKMKILTALYKTLGVKVPIANASRGVYWNELYTNTKEFLCGQTDTLAEPRYDNSVEALSALWKERYAAKRVENLTKTDRPFSTDILFYDDMLYNEWEFIRNKYLG